MVAAAASIAGAVATTAGTIGSMTSGGETKTQKADNSPWSPQQPYLERGFGLAGNTYDTAMGVPLPTNYVAQMNDRQRSADDLLYAAGRGSADQYAPWQSFGSLAAGAGTPYLNNAQRMANGGIGGQSADTQLLSQYARTGLMPGASGVDPRLASSITEAGIGGIGSLGAGASLSQQAGQAALNPYGTVNAAVAGGTALSQNPGLDAAIDAANRDTNRDLTENTLPQLRAAAMSSGNANSSREGALEAISTRGAADRMADTAASMRLGAYSQGANLGATGYNQGLGTAVSAGSALNSNGAVAGGLLTNEQAQQQGQRQFDTSTMLGAANNAASQNLGYQVANANASLQGNAQIGNGIGLGMNATDHATQGIISGANAAYAAGSNEQAGDAARINDGLASYNMQTTAQSNILNNYWNIVGRAGFGSSGTGTVTDQPNNGGLGGALSGAIGGGVAGYGLYKNLKDTFGTGTGEAFTGAGYVPPVGGV